MDGSAGHMDPAGVFSTSPSNHNMRMPNLIPGLTLALVAAARSTNAWSDGHLGVDRPGKDYATVEVSDSAACYAACHDDAPTCKAWAFYSPECDRTAGKALCRLKHAVPFQALAGTTTACEVRSGVPAAEVGLLPLEFTPLKLGSVKPTGWLRSQLVIMANGLSGHLDRFWVDVNQSVWVGGKFDHSGAGHERGPYWLNGVVPLVAQLNASGDASGLNVDLVEQVNQWIYYILEHQTAEGWLGPDDGFGGKGNTYWTGWNTAAALLQYADAMPDSEASVAARCNKAVLDYITLVHTRMLTVPMATWSQNRWQDWAYIVHWMSDQAAQGKEQLLWDAAELTQQQGWDWDAYYAQTGTGSTGAFVGKPMPKFPKENVRRRPCRECRLSSRPLQS